MAAGRIWTPASARAPHSEPTFGSLHAHLLCGAPCDGTASGRLRMEPPQGMAWIPRRRPGDRVRNKRVHGAALSSCKAGCRFMRFGPRSRVSPTPAVLYGTGGDSGIERGGGHPRLGQEMVAPFAPLPPGFVRPSAGRPPTSPGGTLAPAPGSHHALYGTPLGCRPPTRWHVQDLENPNATGGRAVASPDRRRARLRTA